MTALPQTGLMVDAPPAAPSSASSSSEEKQHQQLGTEDDGVSGGVRPCDSEPVTELGVDLPVVVGGGDAGDIEGADCKTNRVKTCPRCAQEFQDEARYEKHCKKCCDD